MKREGKLPFVIVFVYSVYWSSKSFCDFPLALSILLLILLQHRQICFLSLSRTLCVLFHIAMSMLFFIDDGMCVCVFFYYLYRLPFSIFSMLFGCHISTLPAMVGCVLSCASHVLYLGQKNLYNNNHNHWGWGIQTNAKNSVKASNPIDGARNTISDARFSVKLVCLMM